LEVLTWLKKDEFLDELGPTFAYDPVGGLARLGGLQSGCDYCNPLWGLQLDK
jgi:hypothetical protein